MVWKTLSLSFDYISIETFEVLHASTGTAL